MKTTTKFIGSNGKKGVTVYKPMDIKTLSKGFHIMNKNGISKLHIMDDEVIYKITKKEIDSKVRRKLLSHPHSILYFRVFNEYSKRGYLDWKNSYQINSNYLKDIDGNIYLITKTNENGKIFKYYIVHSKIGIFIKGNLLKHKIKMRMY